MVGDPASGAMDLPQVTRYFGTDSTEHYRIVVYDWMHHNRTVHWMAIFILRRRQCRVWLATHDGVLAEHLRARDLGELSP